jgi:hypothetical protein
LLLSSLFAAAFALLLTPAVAEEISSIYTSLDLARCKDVTPADIKDYGTVWRCSSRGPYGDGGPRNSIQARAAE